MRAGARLIVWLLAAALTTGAGAGKESKEVNAALKRVSKSLKGIGVVAAEVEYEDIVEKRSLGGSGKLYVSFAGVVRADIGGAQPRTILFNPPAHGQVERTTFVVVPQRKDALVPKRSTPFEAEPQLLS